MIERINWPRHLPGEYESPFQRGQHERPLRVTFHSSTLSNLPSEELLAQEVLLELCRLSEIEAFQTEPGHYPQIQIDPFDTNADHISVDVSKGKDPWRHTSIGNPAQWLNIASQLAQKDNLPHPAIGETLSDLIMARAHHSLDQDILITTSECLLTHRTEAFIRDANPRKPSEAVKVVGLFLRSRGNFHYVVTDSGRASLGRGLFYWVLTRQKLPSLWRYFSACIAAENLRHDNTSYLGQSVLERCFRAVQALDAIGEQFYMPQNNSTRDMMMYHFDYLTLLLAGAVDAQARIAYRTYKVESPIERRASFRNPKFIKSLQETSAPALYSLISSEYSQDIMKMIFTLRNTIHGAGLSSLAYESPPDREMSFVQIPNEDFEELWRASERCGSREKWD